MQNNIQIRIPQELREKIKKAAAADRRPVSQWIRNLLEDAVKEVEGDVPQV